MSEIKEFYRGFIMALIELFVEERIDEDTLYEKIDSALTDFERDVIRETSKKSKT